MTAAPKAISHGLGAGAGATFAAFAGISAASAGAVAETASAAATINTPLFIESAPLIRSARSPRRVPRSPPAHKAAKFRLSPTPCTFWRALPGNLDLRPRAAASQKRRQVL